MNPVTDRTNAPRAQLAPITAVVSSENTGGDGI